MQVTHHQEPSGVFEGDVKHVVSVINSHDSYADYLAGYNKAQNKSEYNAQYWKNTTCLNTSR